MSKQRLKFLVEAMPVTPHRTTHPDPGYVRSHRCDVDKAWEWIGAIEDDSRDVEGLDCGKQFLGIGAIPALIRYADLNRPWNIVRRMPSLTDQM